MADDGAEQLGSTNICHYFGKISAIQPFNVASCRVRRRHVVLLHSST